MHEFRELVDSAEDSSGMVGKLFSGICQGNRFGVADEKRRLQFLFQFPDLLGERGLGKIQVLGSCRDVFLFGDFKKIA